MLISSDGHVKLTDFGLSEAGLKKELVKVDLPLTSPIPKISGVLNAKKPVRRGSNTDVKRKEDETENDVNKDMEDDIGKHLGRLDFMREEEM